MGVLAHAGWRLSMQDLGTQLSGLFPLSPIRLLGLTPLWEKAGSEGARPVFKAQGSQEAEVCSRQQSHRQALPDAQPTLTVQASLVRTPVKVLTGPLPLLPTLGRPALVPPPPSQCYPRILGRTIHVTSTPCCLPQRFQEWTSLLSTVPVTVQ